jgi:hypothetical protein
MAPAWCCRAIVRRVRADRGRDKDKDKDKGRDVARDKAVRPRERANDVAAPR